MIKTSKHLIETLHNYPFIIDHTTADAAWHQHKDTLDLLRKLVHGIVPCLVQCDPAFLYSVLVPRRRIPQGLHHQLLGRSLQPSCGYSFSFSRRRDKIAISLEEPHNSETHGPLMRAEPIVFRRNVDVSTTGMALLEANQKICHRLDLIHVPSRDAWCKCDEGGDPVEVLTLHETDDHDCFCCMDREELEHYMALIDAVCVTLFEFRKTTNPRGHCSWLGSRTDNVVSDEENGIYARLTTCAGQDEKPHCSALDGCMVTGLKEARQKYIRRLIGEEERHWESFVVTHPKSGQVFDLSTDPQITRTYSIYPVFFKPDVLLQYENDPTKYSIHGSHISGPRWTLNYAVNNDGLVVVIFEHLKHLPSTVQRHWRAHNVPQKEPLSPEIIEHWFGGSWDFAYDPLFSLKDAIREYEEQTRTRTVAPIWKRKPTSRARDLDFINYVRTGSVKEWESQVDALEQLLVQGLNEQYINDLATARSCRGEKLGSLKQLKLLMETLGVEAALINEWFPPLQELRSLRKSTAHPGQSNVSHDYARHYRDLLERCDKAMRCLFDLARDLNKFPITA